MGTENFHSAPNSVRVIELLIKALFDPVHGADAISHYELVDAANRMRNVGEPPLVSDPELQALLADVLENSTEVFDNIMNGAIHRIGAATKDGRLTPLFEHTTNDTHAQSFDFYDHLDEDCVIVIDVSAYRDDPRALVTLLLVSELWSALQRRKQRTPQGADLPQVNLYLEEAADVVTSDVLTELLAQGRSFGIGVTVLMQFPEQVRDSHRRVYRELINDVGTHITGPLTDPGALATAFATADTPADEMADRIADLRRGEWLVRPAPPFDTDRPAPFVCRPLSLLPGNPDGDEPLTDTEEARFQAHRTRLESRMARNYAVPVPEEPPTTPTDQDTSPHAGPADADGATGTATPATHAIDVDAVTNPILHTERFPSCVTSRDEPPYPLVCTRCESEWPAHADGMRHAIACCHDRQSIDRDDVPICSLDLTLSPTAIHASDYTPAQLRLLGAVYMAHQQHFDPTLEYDIVHDSMKLLVAYVDATDDDVDRLRDDGLLSKDCGRPHTLYTVTPDGRSELNVRHREGVAHGDGKGDLSESSLHVAEVAAGARLCHQQYVAPPDAPGDEVRRYHDIDDGRLDAAVLDADGDVVATLEAERINNDKRRAIPDDYDTMAACTPDDAIWIVKSRSDGHELLQALNDPPDRNARVEKTYSDSMPPQDYKIDTPGLTVVYTFEHLLGRLDDDPEL